MNKVIGITVGTPISAARMEQEIKPVKAVNGVFPDENGNVEIDVGSGSGTGGGIHTGPDAPTDESVSVWIDTDDGEVSEFIPAPATASVGQTIVVKSVDENGRPTEWEAADMASGGGEKEWKKIGLFTAADNINPWIIDADENGNPFQCTEFRIRAKLCFFHLSTNSSINRSIDLYGNNNTKVNVGIAELTGFAGLVKADSIDNAVATFKHPAVIDITTHCGLVVVQTTGEQNNNTPNTATMYTARNRGVPHNADYFDKIAVSLGWATNLVMAGSTLEIWGR